MNVDLVDVVVPTLGRPSLARLLEALAVGPPLPGRVIVVDDRRRPEPPLRLDGRLPPRVELLRTGGRGPAAARNAGWRASRAEWIAFLDDDVLPGSGWAEQLREDLLRLPPRVGASQGRMAVPLPAGRRPTDWERQIGNLQDAQWITADLACRRRMLTRLGGFDERFRRAYREDTDLALRAAGAGFRLARGRRRSCHPIGPDGFWSSLRRQAGNADDALLLAKHGLGWRARAGSPRGRRPLHLLITGAGAIAVVCALAGRRRLARLGAGAWLGGTAELAVARILPGPRTLREVVAMTVTSACIPPLAAGHWLRGLVVALWWRWFESRR